MGESAGMAPSVSDLIGELNCSSDGRGEDAKFELISRGIEVVPELAERDDGELREETRASCESNIAQLLRLMKLGAGADAIVMPVEAAEETLTTSNRPVR